MMLLINTVILFPYRMQVRWAVTFFGDDDALQYIGAMLAPMIALNLVKMASGGQAGIDAVGVGWATPSAGMPRLPDDNPQEHSEKKTAQGKHRQRHWHASICKNGAHQFGHAAWRGLKDLHHLWLCNLDCDNITPPCYVEAATQLLVSRPRPRFYCIRVGGSGQKGVTGRYIYRAKDFFELNGYNEQMLGTGGQDIDLRERFNKRCAAEPEMASEPKSLKFGDVGNAAGFDLPNDFSQPNSKWERGGAKAMNLDPHLLAELENKGITLNTAWQEVNTTSWKISKDTMKPHMVANTDEHDRLKPIGPWWVEMDLWHLNVDPEDMQRGMDMDNESDRQAWEAMLRLWHQYVKSKKRDPTEGRVASAMPPPKSELPEQVDNRFRVGVVVAGLTKMRLMVQSSSTY